MDRCVTRRESCRAYRAEELTSPRSLAGTFRGGPRRNGSASTSPSFSSRRRPRGRQGPPELRLMLPGIAAHCDPSLCGDLGCNVSRHHRRCRCQPEPRNSRQQSWPAYSRAPFSPRSRTARNPQPRSACLDRRRAKRPQAAIGTTASTVPPNATVGFSGRQAKSLREAPGRIRRRPRIRLRRKQKPRCKIRSRTLALNYPHG
jgi:hypothetical protein